MDEYNIKTLTCFTFKNLKYSGEHFKFCIPLDFAKVKGKIVLTELGIINVFRL